MEKQSGACLTYSLLPPSLSNRWLSSQDKSQGPLYMPQSTLPLFILIDPMQRADLRYVNIVPLNVCSCSVNLEWRKSCYPSGQSWGWKDGSLQVAVWGHLTYSNLLRFSEKSTLFRQDLSLKELTFHHPCFTILWVDGTDARFFLPGKKIINPFWTEHSNS